LAILQKFAKATEYLFNNDIKVYASCNKIMDEKEQMSQEAIRNSVVSNLAFAHVCPHACVNSEAGQFRLKTV